MTSGAVILCCLAIFTLVSMVYIRNNCLIKGFAINGITGVGTLYLLNVLSGVTGMAIGFSFYSALVCWVLGLPGVLLLSILRILWI